jgi:hypothetical protein
VTQAPQGASVFSLCGCGLTNRCEKGCEKKSFVMSMSRSLVRRLSRAWVHAVGTTRKPGSESITRRHDDA